VLTGGGSAGAASNTPCIARCLLNPLLDLVYIIAGIMLLLWLLGFSMNVGGGLIHALLVIAVVLVVFQFSQRSSLSGLALELRPTLTLPSEEPDPLARASSTRSTS
jgi:hypothetical protein